jgi:hypothetical protein
MRVKSTGARLDGGSRWVPSRSDAATVESSRPILTGRSKVRLHACATSPTSTWIGVVNIGPADAKVWNSPFSPQGSTRSGRALTISGFRRASVASSVHGGNPFRPKQRCRRASRSSSGTLGGASKSRAQAHVRGRSSLG